METGADRLNPPSHQRYFDKEVFKLGAIHPAGEAFRPLNPQFSCKNIPVNVKKDSAPYTESDDPPLQWRPR
jgi:hypothetical protein